jgi:hypothetical protein
MARAGWSGVMLAFSGPLWSIRTTYLRALLTVLVLLASIAASFAGPIRKGAVMQVKPNSVWFDEAAKLTHWQELKKSGDEAALTSFQEQMLGQREAWQFLKPLKVKILSYEPAKSQVNVEMKTAGRLQGTTWWLDASAVGR